MNLHESNKVSMYDKVIALYNQEQARFSIHKRVPIVMGRIIAARAEIGNCEAILSAGTGGKTKVKTATRDDISEQAVIIFGDLFEYADDKNDLELKSFADQNDSRINGLNEVAHRNLMEALDKKLDALSASLDDTEITQEVRTNFKTSLQSFIQKSGVAGTARTDVTSARERMTKQFQNIDHDLDVLDGLMRRFKRSDADLHARYTSARVIIDRGGAPGGDGVDDVPPDNPPAPPVQ